MRPCLQLFAISQHWCQDCHRGCRHRCWPRHLLWHCLRVLFTSPPEQRTVEPPTRCQTLNPSPYQLRGQFYFLILITNSTNSMRRINIHDIAPLDTIVNEQYRYTVIATFCICLLPSEYIVSTPLVDPAYLEPKDWRVLHTLDQYLAPDQGPNVADPVRDHRMSCRQV